MSDTPAREQYAVRVSQLPAASGLTPDVALVGIKDGLTTVQVSLNEVVDSLPGNIQASAAIAAAAAAENVLVDKVDSSGGNASATVAVVSGETTAQTLADKLGERRSIADAGITPALADVTDLLAAAWSKGGYWFVPNGDYHIAAKGPDSGGLEAYIRKPLTVECAPGARFYGPNVDNDLIRIYASPTLTPSEAELMQVEWYGGIIDQTTQKNSLVVPFAAEYPPANPGTSNTCDGLVFKGEYTSGGVIKNGFRRVHVEGVTFKAGAHWQTAGGDSGLFAVGADVTSAIGNVFIGSRDLGIYHSADGTGTVSGRLYAAQNKFLNCFHGVANKRSSSGVIIDNNEFINCIRAAEVEFEIGAGSDFSGITNNLMISCAIGIRTQRATNCHVTNNTSLEMGATLASGALMTNVGVTGALLEGCENCIVSGNRFNASAAAIAQFTTIRTMIDLKPYTKDGVTTQCAGNTLSFNKGYGWRVLGGNTGDRNAWLENEAPDALTPSVVSSGATLTTEVRVNVATNNREFITQTSYSDGDADNPIIVRRSQAGTGIFFGTNKVGFTIAGNEIFAVTSTVLTAAKPIVFQGLNFSQLASQAIAANLNATVRVTDRSNRKATYDGTSWRFEDGTVVA